MLQDHARVKRLHAIVEGPELAKSGGNQDFAIARPQEGATGAADSRDLTEDRGRDLGAARWLHAFTDRRDAYGGNRLARINAQGRTNRANTRNDHAIDERVAAPPRFAQNLRNFRLCVGVLATCLGRSRK